MKGRHRTPEAVMTEMLGADGKPGSTDHRAWPECQRVSSGEIREAPPHLAAPDVIPSGILRLGSVVGM